MRRKFLRMKNLKRVINKKIDDKESYALDRCISLMYGEEKFGLYKYGYVEDLEKMDGKNLYEHYIKLIDTAKIDIFVSGNINKNNVVDVTKKNENIKKILKNSQITSIKSNILLTNICDICIINL